MSNIFIKDGNGVTIEVFTFEDSTSVHHNASVPILTDGTVIFTSANPAVVALQGQLPAGTQHLGKVSVEGLTIGAGSGLTVSVGGAVSAQAVPVGFSDGSNYRIPYADASGVQRVSTAGLVSVWPANTIVPDTDGKSLHGFQADHVLAANYVRNRNSNTYDMMTGTSLGLLIDSTSPIGVSAASKGFPNTDGAGLGTVAHLRVVNAGYAYNRVSDTWDRMTGTSVGLNVIGGVSSGQAQVAGMMPVGGRDGTSNQMLFVDSSGRARVMVSNVGFDVSISPTQANIPVSIAGTPLVSVNGTAKTVLWDSSNNVPLRLLGSNLDGNAPSGTFNHLVVDSFTMAYNKTSDTFDRVTGSSVGLNVISKARYSATLPTLADGEVSVLQVGSRGSLNVTLVAPDSAGVMGLTNSMADAKANNINRIPTEDYLMVYNTSGGNWDRWDGKVSVGAIAVSVPPISGGTQLVSVGGATSVQAVQIAARDINGNARIPLTHTDGALLVHVCAGGGSAAGGGGPTVSVGGAVSVQAVPVAGEDVNGIVRLLKTAIDGTLKSSGFITIPSYSFTRPTDTVTYAAGDLLANSTVAGTVVPLSWPVSRLTGGGGTLSIRRGRARKTGLNVANCGLRVHIFATAAGVSVSTGDNRVFTSVWSPASKYVGSLDIPIDRPGKDGSFGEGTPSTGNEININLTSGATSISGLLEMRGAYVPLSGETFTVDLEIYQD